MKHFTIARVAKFTKRSGATIRRLIKNNTLKAELVNNEWQVQAEGGVSEIQMKVAAAIKRNSPKRKPKIPNNGLGLIVKLAAFNKDKIELLVSIGEKYSVEELELILKL